jgi:hypothetical protein
MQTLQPTVRVYLSQLARSPSFAWYDYSADEKKKVKTIDHVPVPLVAVDEIR